MDDEKMIISEKMSGANQEIDRTVAIPRVQTAGNNGMKKEPADSKNSGKKNLFSFFSFYNRTSITSRFFLKKKQPDDFYGRHLSRFSELPMDQSPEMDPKASVSAESAYEKLEDFNEGGQGIISAARDRSLGRIIALKTLRPSPDDPEKSIHDFITEAKLTAQLDHPGIIPVYSLNQDQNGGYHLAMKLVNGMTLRDHLKNTILNYRRHGIMAFNEREGLFKRLEIFLHVCDAMAYAHHKKIMHCDLKPENIMIGEYMEIYVMDWGIAHPVPVRDEIREEKEVASISGTPRFLSPEAVNGMVCDERADIYALGLILQELATLQFGMDGSCNEEIFEKIRAGELAEIKHIFDFPIDNDLKAIIRKATAYDRDQRYQSAVELAHDLREYMRGNEVSANPDSAWTKVLRWTAHHQKTMLAILFMAILLIMGEIAFIIYHSLQQSRSAGERVRALSFAYGKCMNNAALLDRTFLNQEKTLSLLADKAADLLAFHQEEQSLFGRSRKNNSGRGLQFIPASAGNKNMLRLPGDTFYSHEYGDMISFSIGIHNLNPAISEQTYLETAQLLSPLYHRMSPGILDSGILLDAELRKKEPEKNYTLQEKSRKSLVKSFFIGLENGILLSYPWRKTYDGKVDPRQRSWYLNGKKSDVPSWGKPYIGADYKAGTALPCSTRIMGDNGIFYGVVGMDISCRNLTGLLERMNGAYVEETALVDSQGYVIVSTDMAKHRTADIAASRKDLKLPLYSNSNVRKAIRDSLFGFYSEQHPVHGEIIYLFAAIRSMNCTFIQKIHFQNYLLLFRKWMPSQKEMDMNPRNAVDIFLQRISEKNDSEKR